MSIDKSAQAARQKKSGSGGKFGTTPKAESTGPSLDAVAALAKFDENFTAHGPVTRLRPYRSHDVQVSGGRSYMASTNAVGHVFVQFGAEGRAVITEAFVTSDDVYEVRNTYFDTTGEAKTYPGIHDVDYEQTDSDNIADAHGDFIREIQRGTLPDPV